MIFYAEVQNDKAVVEIPSPVEGTVEEIFVEEGTVAVVGDVLIRFDAPGYEDLKLKGDDHHEEMKQLKQKRKYKQLLNRSRCCKSQKLQKATQQQLKLLQ